MVVSQSVQKKFPESSVTDSARKKLRLIFSKSERNKRNIIRSAKVSLHGGQTLP